METELPSNFFSNKLSLKEAVLFRKLRNDQKLNSKSDVSASNSSTDPPDLAKEASESTPIKIRTKLMKNRQELDELLHNGPDVLKQKSESSKSLRLYDDVNIEVSSLQSKLLQQVTKNVEEIEDSLSDDEIKKPTDDAPLNLSDEDSTFKTQTLPSNDESHSLKENNPSSTEAMKKASINAQSSRSSSFQDKQTTVTSSSSLYYEIAKLRPPPRLRKSNVNSNSYHFHQQLDPKSAKAILRKFAKRSLSTTSSNGSIQSSDDKHTENLSLRSASFKTNDVNEPIESSQTENLEYLTCSTSRDQRGSAKLSNVFPKSNFVSNTTTSSGYFSPRTPSVSLSSSNSNASSTTSSKFSSARSSKRSHSSFMSTSERSSTADSELKKIMAKCIESSEQESNVDDEEDVFSVKLWVESSEYANLASHNDDKTEEETRKDVVDDTTCSQTGSFKEPSAPAPSKKLASRRPAAVNRISMVEQPDPAEFKARNRMLSSNVKLRMPGNRSKKNDASRNSRAFALQLKQLSEGSSSPPVMRTPSPNISSRHFGRTSSAKNTSPLKAVPLQNLANINSDLSGSLTHLHEKNSRKVSTTSEKLYNTVSGATGRHLSQESTFFQDEYISSTRNVTRQEYGQFQGSTWSLNPTTKSEEANSRRRVSISHRLKGAFSFQNIRKAISMERLNEEERIKSLSHSYLNEFGEDISRTPRPRSHTANSNSRAPSTGRLYKAPSISSIFTTVRMRKRKSRERREAKLRHTIAVDSKHIAEYETTRDDNFASKIASAKEVSSPGHFSMNKGLSGQIFNSNITITQRRWFKALARTSIGRVLDMNVKENSVLVEMEKPTSGPFGFYIARRKENGNVYITSMNDSYPDKMYAGLMKLGDEITEVNGFNVNQMTLDQIYDVMSENIRLVLRIKPSQIHVV